MATSTRKINADKMLAQLCRDSYYQFFLSFVPLVFAEKLVNNWHIEKLCDELQVMCERVFRSQPKEYDLICNCMPGTSKPVWEGMPVMMADGTWKLLCDIGVGDMVIGKSGSPCRVNEVHQQGMLPCTRITTYGGRRIIAAHDHPILTTEGWVVAGRILPGAALALMHRPQITPQDSNRKDAEFRVAGYLIGDGALTQNNCNVTNKDPDYIADLCASVDALGFTTNIRKAKNGVTIISLKQRRGDGGIAPRGQGPRDWCREIGIAGKSSYTKRVPTFVWKGTNAQAAQFLACYFHCNGCVSVRNDGKRAMQVSCCTVSEGLASDLQKLFLRLGVSMRLARHVNKNGFKYNRALEGYVTYHVETTNQDAAARFLEVIPLLGRKRRKLEEFRPQRRTFTQEYWPDEVKSVERTVPARCRCLTVEGDASFCVNGVVVHNSTIFSILLQPWAWTRMPSMRFITGSYAESLALDLSRKSRDVVLSEKYRHFFPEIQLREDQNTKGYWTNTAGGFRKAVGVGGAVIGLHAHAICVPGCTPILTEMGEIAISNIVQSRLPIRVLGFDHVAEQLVWKPIVGYGQTPGREVNRIVLNTGTSLDITDNHPVFVVGKGYTPAGSLAVGDRIIYVSSVPELRNFSLQVPSTSQADCTGVITAVVQKVWIPETVYNLEVDGTHNYFAAGVLVHNCIDDPIDPLGSLSELILKESNDWISETLSQRKVDKNVSFMATVMQRLHQIDATGDQLEKAMNRTLMDSPTHEQIQRLGRIRHICLPSDIDWPVFPPDWKAYYKEADGLFDPRRYNRQTLEDQLRVLGEVGYAGQYGQQPSPRGGSMFRIDRLMFEPQIPVKWKRGPVRYWDKSSTQGGGTWTVGVKMAMDFEERVWVLDMQRFQMEPGSREKQIMRIAAIDGKACRIGIEQEPGGGGKEQAMNAARSYAKHGFRCVIDLVRASKEDRAGGMNNEARADTFATQVNTYNVVLVPAPWNKAYIEELKLFPNSKFKDIVDSSTGAYGMLSKQRLRLGVFK